MFPEYSKSHKWFQVLVNSLENNIVKKGRSHYLLKKAVTKKKKDESMKLDRIKEERLKSIPTLKNEIEELKKELDSCNKEIDQAEHERSMLKKLFDEGFIDRNGNIIK